MLICPLLTFFLYVMALNCLFVPCSKNYNQKLQNAKSTPWILILCLHHLPCNNKGTGLTQPWNCLSTFKFISSLWKWGTDCNSRCQHYLWQGDYVFISICVQVCHHSVCKHDRSIFEWHLIKLHGGAKWGPVHNPLKFGLQVYCVLSTHRNYWMKI